MFYLEEQVARALSFHKAGKYPEAEEAYRSVLKAFPFNEQVLLNLGALYRQLNRPNLSLLCYQKCLKINPENTAVLGNLANALKDLHRLDEAEQVHKKAISAFPEDRQAFFNFSCTLREANKYREALSNLDLAESFTSEKDEKFLSQIRWERAQNLLCLGEYNLGWKLYEYRWHARKLVDHDIDIPIWNGQDLYGKIILVFSEQGYGDTIFAARYLIELKNLGAKVIFRCKKELHGILQESGADHLIDVDQNLNALEMSPDYRIAIMSLMGALGTTVNSILPPLKISVPDKSRKKFKYLGQNKKEKKIGIVWSGSITFQNNHNRSVQLRLFESILENVNCQFFSFQKGPRAKDLLNTGLNLFIEDLGESIDDFGDTAAALEHMDAIVMTDSSVAHLAASMRKKVVNMLNYAPYWIYALDEGKTPWYPTMNLIRQRRPNDWADVINRAIKNLSDMSLLN